MVCSEENSLHPIQNQYTYIHMHVYISPVFGTSYAK